MIRHRIEQVAAALGVKAEFFYEARLWSVRRVFDAKQVGMEQALANVVRWPQITETAAP